MRIYQNSLNIGELSNEDWEAFERAALKAESVGGYIEVHPTPNGPRIRLVKG